MFRVIDPNTWYVDHHGTPAKSCVLPTTKFTTSEKGRTCIASMFRFNHDFEPVNKADADRIAEEIETAEHIKKLRDMREMKIDKFNTAFLSIKFISMTSQEMYLP